MTPPVEELTDAAVIARVLAGDGDAFGILVARWKGVLFSQALRMLNNKQDAEDIVQLALVRAHRALGNFRGECSFGTWATLIVRRMAMNHWEYRRRRRANVTSSIDAENPEGGDFHAILRSDEAAPDRAMLLAEFEEVAMACIERLSVQQKEILLMRAVRHLAYDEIAAQMGLNEGTVKSRLARARARLLKEMSAVCPRWDDEILPKETHIKT